MTDSTYPSDGTVAMSPLGDEVQKKEEQTLQSEAKRAHEKGARVTARIVVTVVAIILGILLVLFVVARVALYDSVFALLGEIGASLGLVISRIFS